MDKRIINIITSIVMLLAFFMPWVTFMGFGGSPYKMVSELIKQVLKNPEYVEREPAILLAFLLLIFPICSAAVLYFYSKNEIKKQYLPIIHISKKSPLIFIIIIIAYSINGMGDSAEMLLDDAIFEVIGIGLILTIVSSIILFFNETVALEYSQKNTLEKEVQKEDPKEGINTDDLFK